MEHLIPPEWFDGLASGWLMLVGAVATAGLIAGADLLVGGASGVARRLGMSKVIIGATIVSLGTTSPEAAVSVMAAWRGDAGLALGNAAGSIIADTALIFGIGCLLARLPADRFLLRRQGILQGGVVLLLAACVYGAWWLYPEAPRIGRPVGVLLAVLLAGYILISIRWAREHPGGAEKVLGTEEAEVRPAPLWRQLAGVGAGLLLVLFGGHVLIIVVAELAEMWGVPRAVIAGTLVAFGTSLPELAVGLMAIYRKQPELLIGNVIGADILNVLFVVGASAVAKPLPILEPGTSAPAIFLWLHMPAMLMVVGLFQLWLLVAIRRGHFARWQGAPLLVLYVVYVVSQYTLS